MKLVIINIRSVKLHTPEPLYPDTDDDGVERAAGTTTNTTGDTTTIDPVSIRVFELPAPDTLNDEVLRVVVAHPMSNIPDRSLSPLIEADETARPLSPLIEASGSVAGAV